MTGGPDHRADIERIVRSRGYEDFRWIAPRDVVVGRWVRVKCMFGCPEYGSSACCPPHTPTVDECEAFFREYDEALVFRFQKRVAAAHDRHAWSREVNGKLLELERAVFLAGFPKAFLLFMDSCTLCGDCTGARTTCRDKGGARPSPEAMAVDVFQTVERIGYPLSVLKDTKEEMSRFAFLLIA